MRAASGCGTRAMAARRITVSTAGIAKMIRKLAEDGTKFNLALSLHAANDAKRDRIMPINEQNIPTGEITPVEGTPFDFRELRPVAPGMEADDPQIKQARGYDHCLCIDGYQYCRNLRRAMHVEEMWTGRELDYYTTAPGVQLYTGNWLGDEHANQSHQACHDGCQNQPKWPFS